MLTYIILQFGGFNFPKDQSAFLISYIISTGGDPAPYMSTFETHFFTYYWIVVFHIISWLFIPVVIALVADSTYRLFEKRKSLSKVILNNKMRKILSEETGMSEKEILEKIEEFNLILEKKEHL